MKSLKISTSAYPKFGFRLKITLWSIFFIVNFFLWYNRFFPLLAAVLLSLLLAAEIGGMLSVGYFRLSKREKFPKLEFWSWVLVFSTIRFLVVYFVLQYEVPMDTVFRYPERSIFFIVATSAGFVFWGYSYSIYEWGLAAREKFMLQKNTDDKKMNHPISIRSSGKNVYLMTHDILYLEANGEYVKYVCRHGNFMSFQRMKKAESDLNAYGFIRIHRSYIVNSIAVESTNSSTVTLQNKLELPLSKRYREVLERRFSTGTITKIQ